MEKRLYEMGNLQDNGFGGYDTIYIKIKKKNNTALIRTREWSCYFSKSQLRPESQPNHPFLGEEHFDRIAAPAQPIV